MCNFYKVAWLFSTNDSGDGDSSVTGQGFSALLLFCATTETNARNMEPAGAIPWMCAASSSDDLWEWNMHLSTVMPMPRGAL